MSLIWNRIFRTNLDRAVLFGTFALSLVQHWTHARCTRHGTRAQLFAEGSVERLTRSPISVLEPGAWRPSATGRG